MEEGTHTIKEFVKNYTNKNRNTLLDILIICIPALVITSIWFRGGMIIAGHEPGPWMLDSFRWLDLTSYSWSSVYGTGTPHSRGLIGIPFHVTGAVLQAIGFSPLTKEFAYFASTLALDGLFMYFLSVTVVKGKERRLVGILAGLFYMLNTFQLQSWNRMSLTFFVMPVLPLVLALYIRGIEHRKNMLIWGLVISGALIWFNLVFAILPLIVPIILTAYLLYYVVINRRDKTKVIYSFKFTTVAIGMFAVLSSWWILPVYVNTMYANTPESVSTLQTDVNILKYSSSTHASLLDSIRLIGLSHSMIPLYPFYASGALNYEPSYITCCWKSSPTFGLAAPIGFLIPILAFLALLLGRRNPIIGYFAIVALIGIFLSNGSNPPFGSQFEWFYLNISIFASLRTLFEKAGSLIALGYAPLIAVTLTTLFYSNKSFWNKSLKQYIKLQIPRITALTVAAVLFGPYLWPMWTGAVFSHPWIANSPFYTQVPEYYYDAKEWLSHQQGDWRVLAVPMGAADGAKYNWEYGYTGAFPHYVIFDKPFILSKGLSGYHLVSKDILFKSTEAPYIHDLWKLVSMLNVRYLLLQGDVDTEFPHPMRQSVEDAKQMLEYKVEPNMTSHVSEITIDKRIKFTDPKSIANVGKSIEEYELQKKPVTLISGKSNDKGEFNVKINLSDIAIPVEKIGMGIKSDQSLDLSINIGYMQYGNYFEKLLGNYLIQEEDVNEWKHYKLDLIKSLGIDNLEGTKLDNIAVSILGLKPEQKFQVKLSPIALETTSFDGVYYDMNVMDRLDVVQAQPANYTLAIDTKDTVQNKPTILLSGPTFSGGLLLKYNIPKELISKSWSENSFYEFWFKSDRPQKLWIELDDSNMNHRAWDGRFDVEFRINDGEVNTWKHFFVPVKIKGGIDSGFNFTSVSHLLFGIVGQDYTSTFKVGGVKIISPKFESVKEIKHVATFGNLSFYKLDDSIYIDRIHATNQIYTLKESYEFLDLLDEDTFVPSDSVVFIGKGSFYGQEYSVYTDDQLLELQKLKSDHLYKPDISFKMINPAKYLVHVNNSTEPFFLILNETFDPLWKAYISDEMVKDTRHYMANIFANAWYIEKTGSYDILLEYQPQRFGEYGTIVSAFSLTGFASLIILGRGQNNGLDLFKKFLTFTIRKKKEDISYN